jgi:ABC-2 type transport system ATP-binding protein
MVPEDAAAALRHYGWMHDGRIEVDGLTKHFGAVRAVQNLSFAVEPGSVTGFLGPNGAGKTTTLRMLLGLVRPTAGTATIGGSPFDRLGNPGRVVGAVLEAQNFHPGRRARDHLRCYAAAMAVPPRRVDEVIELVGLQPAARRSARGYSLGMKQRLALATALLGDPQVLVLDEPANGLDPEGIAWLRTFLQTFARSGRTVLVSSHILAEVEQTVDQVVIVSRGECVYHGQLDDLRAGQRKRVIVEAADPSKLVGALQAAGFCAIDLTRDGRLSVSDVDRRQLGDLALEAGVALYGIAEERIELEQIFFQLTSGQFTAGQPYGWAPGYGPTPPLGQYSPPGYGGQPGYPPAGYGPPPGYPPAGYGPPPGYLPAGYGPPPGYLPAGYGPPPAYGPTDSYPPTSYGPPPAPGPAAGYSPERSPYAPPADYRPGGDG